MSDYKYTMHHGHIKVKNPRNFPGVTLTYFPPNQNLSGEVIVTKRKKSKVVWERTEYPWGIRDITELIPRLNEYFNTTFA